MKLVSLLSVLLTSLVPCMGASGQATKPAARSVKTSKPNVIFILVDDMGWGDLDSNWSQQKLNGRTVERKNEFKTPALSALAREGIQLRRHYSAAPVCAPARASLLLGVHQGNSRVVRNNRFDQPIEDSHTLGTVMRDAGYDTAAIGKWGVGGGGQSHVPMTAGPHQRGFNYFTVSWTIWQGIFTILPNPVTFSNTTVTLPIPSGKISRTRCPRRLIPRIYLPPAPSSGLWTSASSPARPESRFSCTWLFRRPTAIWWFRGSLSFRRRIERRPAMGKEGRHGIREYGF